MSNNTEFIPKGIRLKIAALRFDVEKDIVDDLEKAMNECFRKSNAMQLIDKERQEQKDKHGFDENHDDGHDEGELSMASRAIVSRKDKYWPDGWDLGTFNHIMSKKRSEQLIIAAAFAKAELERLEREITITLSIGK